MYFLFCWMLDQTCGQCRSASISVHIRVCFSIWGCGFFVFVLISNQFDSNHLVILSVHYARLNAKWCSVQPPMLPTLCRFLLSCRVGIDTSIHLYCFSDFNWFGGQKSSQHSRKKQVYSTYAIMMRVLCEIGGTFVMSVISASSTNWGSCRGPGFETRFWVSFMSEYQWWCDRSIFMPLILCTVVRAVFVKTM